MMRNDSYSRGSETTALVGVAALVTREAIALCEAAVPMSARTNVFQRAAEQARELDAAVEQERADRRTLAWALELAAVTLTEARQAVFHSR